MEKQDEHESKEQEFFQVEKIVDSRTRSGNKFYYIKWVGYSSKDNTWEPVGNLQNVLYMIEDFEAKRKARNQAKSKKNPTVNGKVEQPVLK